LRPSPRRARAVRAYLVSRGIPASRLAVQSAGEDAPIEHTTDGVAELQNRNVTFTVTAHRPTAADGAGAAGCVPLPSLLAPSWLHR
jgi:OmpA family